MSKSQRWVKAVTAVNGQMPPVLLEIIHPALEPPIRVVNDVQDLVSRGHTYTACLFRINLPDDSDGKFPEAQLQIDNIGRDLTDWLEVSQGGAGAQVRLIQVLRDYPDDWEGSYLLQLTNLKVDQLTVTGSLGYRRVRDRPAVGLQYRQEVLPPLF